jgi:hypothetical protein
MMTSFRITFENEGGKKYERTVIFDFRQMREVLLESFRDQSQKVAEAIERQNKTNERQARSYFENRRMKRCPMCAERIPVEAMKCSHCQELQEKTDSTK